MIKEIFKPNEDIDTVFTLTYDNSEDRKKSSKKEENALVSCLTWNSTGGCIAVGYCQKIHEEMCSHNSVVAVWSLFTKSFSTSKPTAILDSPVVPLIS